MSQSTLLAEAYYRGVEDAIKLLHRGIDKGLTLAEAEDCLRSAVSKTQLDVQHTTQHTIKENHHEAHS